MKQFALESKEFSMEIFNTEFQLVMKCISKILGKEDDNTIGKLVLGMFALMMKLGVVLDIPSYWQEVSILNS